MVYSSSNTYVYVIQNVAPPAAGGDAPPAPPPDDHEWGDVDEDDEDDEDDEVGGEEEVQAAQEDGDGAANAPQQQAEQVNQGQLVMIEVALTETKHQIQGGEFEIFLTERQLKKLIDQLY